MWRRVCPPPVSIGVHRIFVGLDQVPTVAVQYGWRVAFVPVSTDVQISMFAQRFCPDSSVSLCQGSGL